MLRDGICRVLRRKVSCSETGLWVNPFSIRLLRRAELKELIELLELGVYGFSKMSKNAANRKEKKAMQVIPLFGRDEMNLVEFPFGPVTATSSKSFEVDHAVFDRQLKREVVRRLLITGSDAFGLPRPIDDQVLVGMKALTYESGFKSRKVRFSRYQLCKTLGWKTDGRVYKRLEASFDRIAGTTLKFKDSWWDKGEQEWKSKTFHLIDEVELCSKDRLDRKRIQSKSTGLQLCSFTWNETIWKSFSDGNIKKLDMEMFRRVKAGRRKEIPLRLYRILDKRFYNSATARFELEKLCKGTLGLDAKYCPSEMVRILQRAADWLIACNFMSSYDIRQKRNRGLLEVVFYKRGFKASKKKSMKTRPSAILTTYDSFPEKRKEHLLMEAIAFCQKNHPHLVEGYNRNKGNGNDSERSYLEMILKEHYRFQTLVT